MTIASGEMYPVCGIFIRRRTTRLFVDNSSVGDAGNGTPDKVSDGRSGEDPPKNETGRTVIDPIFENGFRPVSAENGSCMISTSLSKKERRYDAEVNSTDAIAMPDRTDDVRHARLWVDVELPVLYDNRQKSAKYPPFPSQVLCLCR